MTVAFFHGLGVEWGLNLKAEGELSTNVQRLSAFLATDATRQATHVLGTTTLVTMDCTAVRSQGDPNCFCQSLCPNNAKGN